LGVFGTEHDRSERPVDVEEDAGLARRLRQPRQEAVHDERR
jgi:hypothetical protein